jgi:HD-like signal output (HDOD) protein
MRLVLVDSDHDTADERRRSLRSARPNWDITVVTDAAAAMTALSAAPTAAFIAVLGAPIAESIALFESVKAQWPATLRVALAEFTERSAALRLERSVHRLLHQPGDALTLTVLIERSTTLREAVHDPDVLAAVGGMDAMPRPPVTILALEKALADPDAGVIAVAAVINRDAALVARLLRVVNSSFFGIGRQVTRVDAAVNFMGVSLVRAIAMADGATRAFKVLPDVLDLDQWNTHSVRVATTARDIVLSARPHDRALADEAFLAGLLHDVGQVVLAGVTPDAWRTIESATLVNGLSLDATESASGRISHALVGAYLLSLWGLPTSIVEAVAFHHTPQLLPGLQFDATCAVHIADAIVGRTDRAAPVLHAECLSAAGVTEEQLSAWKARFGALEVAA